MFTNANTGVTIKEPNGEDCRFTAYRWHIQAPVTFKQIAEGRYRTAQLCRRDRPETVGRPRTISSTGPISVLRWRSGIKKRRSSVWAFPPVDERINQEIFLETSDMADQITTSDGVTARRHSNRVCNLKRGLYVDNPASEGGSRSRCRSRMTATTRSPCSSASTKREASGK